MTKKKEQMYIVRCARAGVFFGAIKERRGTEATMPPPCAGKRGTRRDSEH